MATTFDGDPIRSGDRLWKVGFGPATVIEIRHETVLVQLQGRTKKFSLNTGVQSGETHRSYFWFDPIVVIPRKNAHNWNTLKGVIRDFTQRLGNYIDLSTPEMDGSIEGLSELSAQELDQRGLITADMKRRANDLALEQLVAKARDEQNTNITAIQDARA